MRRHVLQAAGLAAISLVAWLLLRPAAPEESQGGASRRDSPPAAPAPPTLSGAPPSHASGPRQPPPEILALLDARSAPKDSRPPTIVVSVVDSAGEAVPCATVVLGGRGGMTAVQGRLDGRAESRADPADLRWIEAFGAKAADGTPLPLGRVRREVADGEDRTALEVRMPPERTIEGRVVGLPGRVPVGGVVLRANWGPPGGATSWGSDYSEAETGDDGRFRIGGLGEGTYRISMATPAGWVAGSVVEAEAGAKGLEIALRPGREARIRVLDESGRPLRDAAVTVLAPGIEWRHWRTGLAGDVILPTLDAGVTWSLVASAPGYLPATRADWRVTDETLQLARGLTISGVVRDPQGRPVEGVPVHVLLSQDGNRRTAWTEADGSFLADGFAPGAYRVAAGRRAERPEAALRARGVPVEAGAADVALTLTPGASLQARVDAWPAGGLGRRAWLVQESGDADRDERHPDVGPDGAVRVEDLEPTATYSLWMHAPAADGYVHATGLRPGEGEHRARFERGLAITGRITLPPGTRDRYVAAWRDPGVLAFGTLEADGRFEVRGLPPGTYEILVKASCEDLERDVVGRGRAAAGSVAVIPVDGD